MQVPIDTQEETLPRNVPNPAPTPPNVASGPPLSHVSWTADCNPNTPPQSDIPTTPQSIVSIPSIWQKCSCLAWASDFVSRSATISLVLMSLKLMDLSLMHSWIKWYCMLMCLVAAWLTGFHASRSVALLSMCKGVD